MTGIGASVALAIVLCWVVFALSGLLMADVWAAALAVAVGVLSVTLFRDTVAVNVMVALLAPFGVMLPVLALRHVGMRFGLEFPVFGTIELAVFLVVYVVFLMAAFDVLPVDLYRYGYAPVPVAAMVLAVCAYGFVTGNWVLPLVAVLGQAFWVMCWGSSNWFDYVLHVVLVPVVAVVLIGRFF